MDYARVPGFTAPAVEGHAGKLSIGYLGSAPVVILNGRSHFYEGHPMDAITFPIRVLAEFGVTDLLLTNAAGGINSRFRAGDLMVVTDHLNFMGMTPLIGPVSKVRTQFVDMTTAYDPRLRIAVDMYNQGLANGLTTKDGNELDLTQRQIRLPFGSLDLQVDQEGFRYGGYHLTKFVSLGDIKVRGLRNRYREAGIGAPQVERAVELGLAAQHAGGELVGEAAVALGQVAHGAVARVVERRARAHRAQDLERRAPRWGRIPNPASLP